MRTSRWIAIFGLLAAGTALAQESHPDVRRTPEAADLVDSQRIIVKFRSGNAGGRAQAQAQAQGADPVAMLTTRAGIALRKARRLSPNLQVLEMEPLAAGETLEQRLARVRADADVEYAEPDRRRFAHALPNDPLYTGQWYLQQRADAVAAIDAEHAWDTTQGAPAVVIAVLDTGVRFDHPDLRKSSAGGRLLPGYDFVSNGTYSNDGDGRDPDPTDPGDFVTQSEAASPAFRGCDVSGSSWHGTRVAGIIGARTNSAEGIAGITWGAGILPVRVLGKCGGMDSDILAGMLWAAGIHVDGVPDNPRPAKIENLSLGGPGNCGITSPYRDVIAQINARGTLVVVSAGNEGGPVNAPANCPGVAAVAGLRHAGTKVGYSSLGPQIALSAPAGNCVLVGIGDPCLFSIDTSINLGSTTPGGSGYTDQIRANYGTSFSAPIVAGIAGLMASVNGNLGSAAMIARLREGALKPFPVSPDATVPQCHVPTGPNDIQGGECSCTTSTCGAGMANAPGALAAALRPIAAIAVQSSVSAGQDVVLSGAGSAGSCERTIASYAWSIVSGTGIGLTNPTPDSAVVIAPATGSVTVRLTVTDDLGRTDSADVEVTSSTASTDAPASAGDEACPIAAPPVEVALTPDTLTLQAGESHTFAATVTRALDTSVTWQVAGVAGGNAAVGTITAAGVYTAPATAPSPATVTVTAVANEDPARSAAAQVTITGVPAAVPSGGGGGGGGAALDLLPLLLVCAARLRRRGSAASSSLWNLRVDGGARSS